MEPSSGGGGAVPTAFHLEIRQTVSLSDLPSCALAPAVSIIGQTGCGTDIACVCRSSSFFSKFTTQIQAVCSTADFGKAIIIGDQLCSQAGVTIASAYVSAASTYVPVSALPTSGSSASAPVTATSSASGSLSTTTTSHPSTSPSAVTIASTLSASVSVSTLSKLGTPLTSMASTSTPSSSSSTTTTTNDTSQTLGSGAIAGIAVGSACAVLVILSLLWFLVLGPRRRKKRPRPAEASSPVLEPEKKEGPVELYAVEWPSRHELPG